MGNFRRRRSGSTRGFMELKEKEKIIKLNSLYNTSVYNELAEEYKFSSYRFGEKNCTDFPEDGSVLNFNSSIFENWHFSIILNSSKQFVTFWAVHDCWATQPNDLLVPRNYILKIKAPLDIEANGEPNPYTREVEKLLDFMKAHPYLAAYRSLFWVDLNYEYATEREAKKQVLWLKKKTLLEQKRRKKLNQKALSLCLRTLEEKAQDAVNWDFICSGENLPYYHQDAKWHFKLFFEGNAYAIRQKSSEIEKELIKTLSKIKKLEAKWEMKANVDTPLIESYKVYKNGKELKAY